MSILCRDDQGGCYCGRDLPVQQTSPQTYPGYSGPPTQTAARPTAPAYQNTQRPVTPQAVVFKRHPATMVVNPIGKMAQSLTVYPDRVVWQEGLLRTTEVIIPIANITDVRVRQSLMGHAAGYGNVTIQSAGSSQAEIVAEGIENPGRIRDLILSYRSQQRR
mgnify:CR=1 FL=1